MTLSTHRLAVALAFATQAFVFITLTTGRLPTARTDWGLSVTSMSLVLLMMVLLSGAGSVLAEKVAAGRDSAVTLRIGLLLIAVSVPFVVLSGSLVPGVAAMAVYGVGLGMVDASTNMQAVALEHLYQRPILPSFHGAWTIGGILGAVAALSTGSLPTWLPALAAIAPAAVAFASFLKQAGVPAVASATGVPWRPILLVGAAMTLFYMVDLATQTWGATYAMDVFDVERGLGAAGVSAYLVASGAVRLMGDTLVRRLGPVPVLRVGAVVGAVGLGIIVAAPSWWVAVGGFALAGAGLAVVAPLSFSAAAGLASLGDQGSDRARVDSVIARFNLFNYAGALLGSVMTGLVGGQDLRWGFLAPAVLVLAIIPLAGAFVAGRANANAGGAVTAPPA